MNTTGRNRKAIGPLMLIGGAEEKEGECIILNEFVRLAGGGDAHIVVMTVATNHPDNVGKRYIDTFANLGARHVTIVDVSLREDTQLRASLAAIKKADAIFFTGGDQLHITSLLGGTEMDKLLHERSEEGVLLAGTSAGAAMMSSSMIIGGMAEQTPNMEGVRMAPGMEFILGAAVDTHFSQRGRHGRLLTAIAHYPHNLGIGIDENTAIVVHDGKFQVIGCGCVTVFDLGGMSHTNLPDLVEGENLALFDIKLHVLPDGYCFDLMNRRPTISKEQLDAEKQNSGNRARSKTDTRNPMKSSDSGSSKKSGRAAGKKAPAADAAKRKTSGSKRA